VNFLKWFFGITAAGIASGALLAVFIFAFIYRQLPPIDNLVDYRPQVPLRIWSADGQLIGEFGQERRDFVHLKDVPDHVKKAILAAEDAGFYEHPGIEISGIVRAAIANFVTGRRSQGGSTITQQVARNFFLSSERTYIRKLYEIAMSFKIEQTLTKDEILEIYINQIYLGQHAYGFQSAARTYFGRTLDQISVGEAATLAGLPVAPSAYNPIVNPTRATMRKNYVLRRMYDLGFIDELTYTTEKAQPMQTRRVATAAEALAKNDDTASAKYAAEVARMLVYDIFKDETYTRGINVYTTIRMDKQKAAVDAVRRHLIAYDRRYGYRGPEGHVDLGDEANRPKAIKAALSKTASSPFMVPAVVLEASTSKITAALSANETVELDAQSLKFGRRYLGKNSRVKESDRLRPGSIIRVTRSQGGKGWTLAQVPRVEAAFVAGNYNTGAVYAMVGGFDFNRNMFNHVTQAWRQPGSSFKPFIYSAALDKGFTTTTIINDAPISIDPRLTGNKLWEPRNYEGRFDGPMTLRRGLEKSKNLISIRILQAITPKYAQEYITKFGFSADKHPAVLPMALGAGSVTPWQMLGGYTVFANGGYRVTPYLIERVTDVDGRTLMRSTNRSAGDEAIRAITDRNAYIMQSLLHGVAVRGTAARATRELKRSDIGGKTGTTNNAHDAWFCGWAGDEVAVTWMGYDTPKPLGSRETGGGLSLPIWIDYMKSAVKGVPEVKRPMPSSVVMSGGEVFYRDPVKDGPVNALDNSTAGTGADSASELVRDQIF
jgi:penicillin-binding protein 1A